MAPMMEWTERAQPSPGHNPAAGLEGIVKPTIGIELNIQLLSPILLIKYI